MNENYNTLYSRPDYWIVNLQSEGGTEKRILMSVQATCYLIREHRKPEENEISFVVTRVASCAYARTPM
jgi:hypothetical protein